MRLLFVLSAILSVGSSARILAMLPFFGKSHYIFHSSILHTLAKRGHQVVEYSPHPPKHNVTNLTHVEVHTDFEQVFKSWKYEDFARLFEKFSYFGQGATDMWTILDQICNDTFKHENIKKLLKSDEHFDLVLTTSSFGQESMLVFGQKFHAPTITLQAFAYSSILNNPTGNVMSIATIPDIFSFQFTNRMSFLERFRNFISVTTSLFSYYNTHLRNQDAILKHHLKEDSLPSLVEMVNNVSLTFINSHPTVEYPIPYSPNIVLIGGVNIVPNREPLPQEIKIFMDGAENGLIYFSLGTNIPINIFPSDTLKVFFNVFKRLPQRVLWKIDAESLTDIPSNVKLVKWVPQLKVLEHPNCKLFMTHGGVFSQQEAINAGVPTVGIPFFADQPFNIKFNEHRGIGVGLEFKTLTEDKVFSAIQTVLNDKKYKENAQRLSRIFRDRPLSPADSVVFWVEYVLRHAGAHHLRPASTQLSWYQLALLDVLAVIFIPILIVIFLFYKLCMRLCCKKDVKRISSSKKKN